MDFFVPLVLVTAMPLPERCEQPVFELLIIILDTQSFIHCSLTVDSSLSSNRRAVEQDSENEGLVRIYF